MLSPTRRGFLRKTLGAAWTAGALMDQAVFRAAAARGQARTAPTGLFEIQKMGDGVWGAIAHPAPLINCNAVVFEMSDGLLVVDTHSKPSAAASLIAQVRKEVSRKPVRYLVNSHLHWDHTQGNPAYKKDYPGVQVVTSEATRRMWIELGPRRLKESLDSAAKSLDGYKQKLAAAKTPEEKAYWGRMATDTASFIQEMKTYEPVYPTLTTAGDFTIEDKMQPMQVVFRGRGHTTGDVSVFSPTRKIAATGDLLHGALPYIGDGYPNDWPITLAALTMVGFDKFLGGHGSVETGTTALYRMRNYIEELAVRVQQGKQRGAPLIEIQKTLVPANLKSLQGNYTEAMFAQYEADRKAGLVAPGRSNAELLAGAVSGNVAQVYNALDRPAGS